MTEARRSCKSATHVFNVSIGTAFQKTADFIENEESRGKNVSEQVNAMRVTQFDYSPTLTGGMKHGIKKLSSQALQRSPKNTQMRLNCPPSQKIHDGYVAMHQFR